MFEDFNRRLADIKLSPLGILIAEFLTAHADVPKRGIYERLRDLRQGTLQDLELRKDFQSFLIAHLAITEREVATIRRHLRTFETQRAVVSGQLPYAARGESSDDHLEADSVGELLKRRTFPDNVSVR
jgi:hypothetical protein